MTEHLFGFVARLHAQGHTPQNIYDALVTRIPPKLARRLVHKATGCLVQHRKVPTDQDSSAARSPPGRTPKERTRQKISAACKGKTRSQEARDHISAGVKQSWARRAAATPTQVCARAGCESLVAKATMRYCSPECRKIARRLQAAARDRARRQRIKRYTGHPGHSKNYAAADRITAPAAAPD